MWIESLHDRFTRFNAPPCAPRYLCQQLERALCGTKVGEAKPDVCRNHTDQGDARKVVPLGNHLCANKNVDRPCGHLPENVGGRSFSPNRIAIESRDSCLRPSRRDFSRDALGAEATPLEVRTGARRTYFRHSERIVAVVAPRAMPVFAFCVNDERDAAVRAVECASALAAEHRRRKASPIEQNK